MANNKTDLCQQFEQTVWTYLDDDLSPPERSDWKNHLKACAPCQQTLSGPYHRANLPQFACLQRIGIAHSNPCFPGTIAPGLAKPMVQMAKTPYRPPPGFLSGRRGPCGRRHLRFQPLSPHR